MASQPIMMQGGGGGAGTLDQQEMLRAQGIPEEVISQLLGLASKDPSGMGKQYEQSAYLRRAAPSGDYAKSGAGAIAQGLAGLMVGQADKAYGAKVKGYEADASKARSDWFNTKYPRAKAAPPMYGNSSGMPYRGDEEY